MNINFFNRKPNYKGRLASPFTTKTKQEGLLPTSKEPKKLHFTDHFVRAWEVELHCLGSQWIEMLGESAKRDRESAVMDLIS